MRKIYFSLICLPILCGCESWFSDKKILEGTREPIFQETQTKKKSDVVPTVLLDESVQIDQIDNVGYNPTRMMKHGVLGKNLTLHKVIDVGCYNGKALLAHPLVINNQILVLDSENKIKGYDFNSGEKIWDLDLLDKARNDGDASFGGAMAHHQGVLYVAVSLGELIAVSLEKKEILWRKSTFGVCRGAPVVEKGNVYIVTANNKTIAYDAMTGQQIWINEGMPESASVAVPSSPASSGSAILSPYSSGELMALKPSNGTLLWTKILGMTKGDLAKIFVHLTANPVVKDDAVYVGSLNNEFSKISLKDGNTNWTASVASIGFPILSGNAIFLTTSKRTMVALCQTTGEIIWETQLPAKNPDFFDSFVHWSAPILAGGRLYVTGTMKELFVLDAVNGKILNQLILPSIVTVQPVVVKNTLLLLTQEGEILMYR